MNVGEKTGHNQSLVICSSIITAVKRKPPFPYFSSALVVCTQVFIQRIGLYTQATDVFRDINGDGHGAQKDRRLHLPLLEANGQE